MHRAIQRDHKSELRAKEVHDEALDDLLTAEVQTIDTAATQDRPGLAFGGC